MKEKRRINLNSLNSYGGSTKSVNRLFLCIVIWYLGISNLLAPVLINLGTEQLLVVSQLIYLLPVLLFLIIKRVPVKEWIPFRRIRISTILMIILFSLLLIPLVICLNVLSMLFVTNHLASTQSGLQVNTFLLNLLVMAVLPAVFEEITFRGVFYRAYREKGVLMAAIGCGVTFGFMHMNFNQFFYALALGIAFSLLLEATGSIFATITAHFVINGWSVVMMEVQKMLTAFVESMGQTVDTQTQLPQNQLLILFGVFAVIAAGTTCLAGCVLVWIAKHCGRLEHLKACLKRKPREEGEVRSNRTFVTPVYVIAGVVCIIYMVLMEIWT